MKQPKPASVDDYIAAQPAPVRPILAKLRAAIRKAVPAADEVVSYDMPGYILNGKPVLYFAAWKTFLSVYPIDRRVIDAFHAELAPYVQSKSTARFPLSAPIPFKLIASVAKFRAGEVSNRHRTPRGSRPESTKGVASTSHPPPARTAP